MDALTAARGFDWDEGNVAKTWERHRVTPAECEQTFFNHSSIVAPDVAHSAQETRYYSLGRTDRGRRLFVVFTLRRDRVRVISARDMNRKERERSHAQSEEDPKI